MAVSVPIVDTADATIFNRSFVAEGTPTVGLDAPVGIDRTGTPLATAVDDSGTCTDRPTDRQTTDTAV